MAARRISPRGLEFIKGFESFVPYVYDDLVAPVNGRYREWSGGAVRGTLTIGYGHTNSAKHPLKIRQGLRITEAKAREVLDVDLDEVEDAVNRYVRVPITQGQFDALVSFGFNLGTGGLQKLIIPLNRGDYDGTRRKFDLYVKSKGKVLRGLQRRRDGEQRLWDLVEESERTPDTGPRVDEPADVAIDVPAPDAPVLTPKDVDQPKPPPVTQTTIGKGAGVGIIASITAFLSTVWDSLKELPYSIERFVERFLTDMWSKPAFWAALVAAAAAGFVLWRRKRKLEAEGT